MHGKSLATVHVCNAVIGVDARLRLHDDVLLRKTANNETFVTDRQQFILDAAFGRICDVNGLDKALRAPLDDDETGLFIGLAYRVVSASQSGIKFMEPVDA